VNVPPNFPHHLEVQHQQKWGREAKVVVDA
jgi:hypothetical protein